MMRISTVTVTALQQVDSGPPLLSAISSLRLQNVDLCAALDSLTAKQLEPASLSSLHISFITDFNSLITALLPQMSRLEILATSCRVPLQDTGFSHLWSLLVSSCRVFNFLPFVWPVGHKLAFTPFIATLDTLMSLLLLVTRSRDVPWLEWQAFGPLGRKTQAYTVLYLPMATMINLAMTHPSEHDRELLTMPAMFFAKLCCLSCELLSDLPPQCYTVQRVEVVSNVQKTGGLIVPQSAAFCAPSVTRVTAAEHNGVNVTTAAAQAAAAERELEIDPSGVHPLPRARFTSSYDLFFFYLAASAGNFLRDRISARHDPRLKMFVHPAVILVMKLTLTLRTGVRDKADLVQFCESTAIAILTHLVEYSMDINTKVQAGPGGEEYTRSICGLRFDMGASLRPRVVISDDQLLRTLCRRMCVDATLVNKRNDLMMSLLYCWPAIQADRSCIDLPFPVPDGGEQVCGITTLVHHFSVEVLQWMRAELVRRKQQRGMRQGSRPARVVVSRRQHLLDRSKQVLLLACNMRCIFPLMDAVEGVEDGELNMDPICSPARVCQMLVETVHERVRCLLEEARGKWAAGADNPAAKYVSVSGVVFNKSRAKASVITAVRLKMVKVLNSNTEQN